LDFHELPFDFQKLTAHGRMGQTRGHGLRRIDRSSAAWDYDPTPFAGMVSTTTTHTTT
jgi:hypothetical protein